MAVAGRLNRRRRLQPYHDQMQRAPIHDPTRHRLMRCSRTKRRQTTRRRDFPGSVIITREGHPFEGGALAVIGRIRRRGVLFVLACLPDGSRALIPAQWTDWDEGYCGGVGACREANLGSRALGTLGDLLQLRHLVDALCSRSIGVSTATEGEPSCN